MLGASPPRTLLSMALMKHMFANGLCLSVGTPVARRKACG
ncbi:protein of unknown function [Streptomyces sp. KY75]|nr:protein of unknown function [Streptomyces sp. KY75]CAD5986976.1 protein of unknown function [Streptomyces sp. KY70]